jgi:hypothetical protein
VADAARTAAGELNRLRRAEDKGRSLPDTVRSRLPKALEAILRGADRHSAGSGNKPLM